MNKRNKTRELSEVMHKIIANHVQGYKCSSRDLDIPRSTIHHISKMFRAHGIVANSTGHRHIRGLVRRSQWVNGGESTSVSCHQIEDDIRTHGMTVSCTSGLTQQLASSVKNSKKGSVVREIHEDPADWHKKAWLRFARTCQNINGRMSWGQIGTPYHLYIYRKLN